MRTLLFLVVLVLALGYLADQDGRKIRNLPTEQAKQIKASASLIDAGWVWYDHYPADSNNLYLALYLDNKSEYIIRRIGVRILVNWKSGEQITSISNDPCLTENKSDDLRVLVNDGKTIQGIRPEQYQVCVVKIDLPANIEERAREACGDFNIDDTRWLGDVMKCNPFEFHFDLVEIKGHRQPLEISLQVQEVLDKVFKRRNE